VRHSPALEVILQRNGALATEQAELAPKMQELTTRLREIESELKLLDGKVKTIRDQAEAARFSNAVGVLLRNERARLPDLRHHQRRKALRQSEIANVQIKLIELQNERATARDGETGTKAILDVTSPSATADDRANIEELAHTALRDNRELLLALWHQYGEYLATLVDLDVKQGQLIDKIEEFSDFVNERVFWTRSGPLLGIFSLGDAREAAEWLFDPVAASLMLDTFATGLQHHILTAGPALLSLLVLVLAQRRLRAALRANADLATKPVHVSFADTLQAVLGTVLLALPWPLLLWIVAWRLSTVQNASDWSRAIAVGLAETARIFLPLLLFYHVCRIRGLAGAHFQWPTASVRTIRRNLVWLMIVGLPMVFISAALEGQTDEVRKESLGRLAFLVETSALAVFLYRVLRRRGGVFREILAAQPQGWFNRLRFLWQYGVIAAPLCLAIAAVTGYYFTALQLAARLYWTLIVLAGAATLNAIFLRWLLVARRRLAMAQAKERQAQRLAEKEATGETLGETVTLETATDAIVDLSAVSQQSRQIVRAGLVFGLALSLWLIWSATLPALGVLHTIVIVGEMSLADVGLGVLIGLMTLIALRNLPGLLEMLLLQHLPLDGGARYACSAVSRYVITVTGVIIIFTSLGIGWSQVQWLVAAVTVGLGFGLQEIFANFVSGLILLLERPIRIGDTVTVGGGDGKRLAHTNAGDDYHRLGPQGTHHSEQGIRDRPGG